MDWYDVSFVVCSFNICFADMETTKKWTPLHFAARNGDNDTVELLIKNGANVNAQSEYVCALVAFE